MPSRVIGFWLLIVILVSPVRADEFLRSLKVKGELYTNVTVTEVTATDIYFAHAGGLANAKLKDLDLDLQKHFHFDAARSSEVENAQKQATAVFRARLAEQKPIRPAAPATNAVPAVADTADYVPPEIHARSVRGQPAPQLQVEKWLTDQPATDDKFVLIDFWATWCEPCRQSIPELNGFQKEFSDRLVIIGLSNESGREVRRMRTPSIEYAVAIDPQIRMAKDLQIQGIPHCLLIDPTGIVRYEGNPLYLNDQILKHFLDKYSQ